MRIAPGCEDLLFGVSVDPSGTSFWTGDAISGDVWQVDLATGTVLSSFSTGSPGLSVRAHRGRPAHGGHVADGHHPDADEPRRNPRRRATSPSPTTGVRRADRLHRATRSRASRSPSPSTAARDCTSPPTGSDGMATCDIIPTEPAQSYTLTASFSGDSTSTSTPSARAAARTPSTVTPDTTTLVYTGPTTAVNGSPSPCGRPSPPTTRPRTRR